MCFVLGSSGRKYLGEDQAGTKKHCAYARKHCAYARKHSAGTIIHHAGTIIHCAGTKMLIRD